MKYVQPVGGLANDPYIDANPSSGIDGSPVPAAAIEHPMRELVALIGDAGLAATDADLAQVAKAVRTLIQKQSPVVSAAGGTADAITGTFSPPVTALTNGMKLLVRAGAANATTTPTFTPNSGIIPPKTIVKGAGAALVAGDIVGVGHWIELQYDATLDKWELLNPATWSRIGAFSNYVTLAVDAATLGAGNLNKVNGIGSAVNTLTMADSAIANFGDTVTLHNLKAAAGNVTINRNGTDNFSVNGGTKTSIVLQPGDSVTFYKSAAGVWYALGTATLSDSYAFGNSISTFGYQKLPSGLIIQWGKTSLAAGADTTVTFPIAFPSAVYSIVANSCYTNGTGVLNGFVVISTAPTLTNFVARISANLTDVYWIAIGK